MSNSIPENVMTSVCYRNFLKDNSQFRERDRTKVLEIRNKISNVLSKVKKNTVNVFDQCTSMFITGEPGGDDDFQITMDFKCNKTGLRRMVHLTGLVSSNSFVKGQD